MTDQDIYNLLDRVVTCLERFTDHHTHRARTLKDVFAEEDEVTPVEQVHYAAWSEDEVPF